MNSQDINFQRSLIINKPEYCCLTNKIFHMIKTMGMNRELKNLFWQKDGTLLTWMLPVSSFPSLWSNSHPYMTTGKTIALTIWTFVSKVMSLAF